MGIINWWNEKDEFDKSGYKVGAVILCFIIFIAIMVSYAVDGLFAGFAYVSENGLKDVVEGVWHGSGK